MAISTRLSIILKAVLFLTTGVSVISCERIINKKHQAISKAKEKLQSGRDKLENKMLPIFDPLNADSKYNKQRFYEFFDFGPTPDVQNLYCWADRMGIDASYWLSFECHDSTVGKITHNLQLQPDPQFDITCCNADGRMDSILTSGIRLYGGLNSDPMPWWDTAFINKSIPFGKAKGDTRSYLWHDGVKHKVYFLSFDF